jgi:hypothetical protein
MQSVNATSLKSNFVGYFARARNCIKRTQMKSNQKYKMFVSESSIYPQNFMSIGVRLDTKKIDRSALPSCWTKNDKID